VAAWVVPGRGAAGSLEAGDRFGEALAAGSFNQSVVAGLAVGVPSKDVGAAANAGAVSVLCGTPGTGLSTRGGQLSTQDTPGVPGTAETDDTFGFALATG
jgi:hypothetical protein